MFNLNYINFQKEEKKIEKNKFEEFINKHLLIDTIKFKEFMLMINRKKSIILVLDNNILYVYNYGYHINLNPEYLQSELKLDNNKNNLYKNKIDYITVNGNNRINIKINQYKSGEIKQCYLIIKNNNRIDNLEIINKSIMIKNDVSLNIKSYIYIENDNLIKNIYYNNCEFTYDELKNTKLIQYQYTKEELDTIKDEHKNKESEYRLWKEKKNILNDIEKEYVRKEEELLKASNNIRNINDLYQNKIKEREMQDKLYLEREQKITELINKRNIEDLQHYKYFKEENDITKDVEKKIDLFKNNENKNIEELKKND